MKKIVILLDEWKNNKNFIFNELDDLQKYFEIVIVHNDSKIECEDCNSNIKFVSYDVNKKRRLVKSVLNCIFDIEVYREILNMYNSEEASYLAKIVEIIKFYIKAELFYYFLKSEGLIINDENMVYYSYWNFYKCYAITKHKNEIIKSKIISRIHGYDLYKYRIPSGYQPFKKSMDDKLDKLFFISEYGKDYYHKTYHIIAGEKHDLRKLGTCNPFGIGYYCKSNIINIVSCSRIIELKRIDLIIKALSMIEDITIDWKHFGDGPLLDDMKELAIQLLSKKHNISYDFKGYTLIDEIYSYYFENSIDAFILTSNTEGNPVSVIEAMSFGIPIISTNICNMPNLVSDNGLLISENPDPYELSDAITRLSRMSKDDVSKMRIASRNRWEKEYKAENNCREFAMELNGL